MTISELKQPPNSHEAEQALIGAVMLRPEVLAEISLTPAEFYRREHRVLWEAILALTEARKPIDLLSISDWLSDANRMADAGGLDYLSDIFANIHSAANAVHYAELIANKATRRRLISIAYAIADKGYNEPELQEAIDFAQREISDVRVADSREPLSIDHHMKHAIAALQQRLDSKGALLGLSTGFADLDFRTQGLRPGHLVVIAGRPGMGKTTLACNIAEHAVTQGKFVITFSLEMSAGELTDKMACSLGRIDYQRMQDGKLNEDEWDKFHSVACRIKGRPYYIDDDGSLTSQVLISRARRIAQRIGRKPDLIVVDYLQLLRDKGEGVDRVTGISRNLKMAARELHCPLIALSQLSRKVEERADRRPVPSDLRDSGSIEQDADLIWMLYRDEEYNPNTQHPGLAEVICAKWRFGKKGTDILNSSTLGFCRFESSTVRHIERALPQKRRAGGFNYED